jgi:hypothetical protein
LLLRVVKPSFYAENLNLAMRFTISYPPESSRTSTIAFGRVYSLKPQSCLPFELLSERTTVQIVPAIVVMFL